jgi:hypothetical protein
MRTADLIWRQQWQAWDRISEIERAYEPMRQALLQRLAELIEQKRAELRT